MISVEGITFSYRAGQPVFEGFSVAFEAGVNLIVGPNGCGKSTLLKMVVGVEHPHGGRILVGGHDLWRDEVRARAGLAYLPERPDLTPFATVHEILLMVARLRGEPPECVEEALVWSGIPHLRQRTVHELSKGERRRAVLASCRIGEPEHLIFDEPLDAMDRAFRTRLVEWIGSRSNDGATIVLVSHEIESFAAIADRVLSLAVQPAEIVDDLPAGVADRLVEIDRLARICGD